MAVKLQMSRPIVICYGKTGWHLGIPPFAWPIALLM